MIPPDTAEQEPQRFICDAGACRERAAVLVHDGDEFDAYCAAHAPTAEQEPQL